MPQESRHQPWMLPMGLVPHPRHVEVGSGCLQLDHPPLPSKPCCALHSQDAFPAIFSQPKEGRRDCVAEGSISISLQHCSGWSGTRQGPLGALLRGTMGQGEMGCM